jgi:hypothetical protein
MVLIMPNENVGTLFVVGNKTKNNSEIYKHKPV